MNTRPDPCVPVRQATLGEKGLTAGAHDVQRINTFGALPVAGNLVVTGFAEAEEQDSALHRDTFLLRLNAADFTPSFGFRYGRLDDEVGRSVTVLHDGFAISDRTTSDWDSSGDPQDLNVVRTDFAGDSGPTCQQPWKVEPRYIDTPPRIVYVDHRHVLQPITPELQTREPEQTDIPTCPSEMCPLQCSPTAPPQLPK